MRSRWRHGILRQLVAQVAPRSWRSCALRSCLATVLLALADALAVRARGRVQGPRANAGGWVGWVFGGWLLFERGCRVPMRRERRLRRQTRDLGAALPRQRRNRDLGAALPRQRRNRDLVSGVDGGTLVNVRVWWLFEEIE